MSISSEGRYQSLSVIPQLILLPKRKTPSPQERGLSPNSCSTPPQRPVPYIVFLQPAYFRHFKSSKWNNRIPGHIKARVLCSCLTVSFPLLRSIVRCVDPCHCLSPVWGAPGALVKLLYSVLSTTVWSSCLLIGNHMLILLRRPETEPVTCESPLPFDWLY